MAAFVDGISLQDFPVARSERLASFALRGVTEVGEEIGRGAYAIVVEMRYRGLRCAGKQIHSELYRSASPEGKDAVLRRFEEECEILSSLHHPHIVQFLGVHFEPGARLPILVMECLDISLSSCLKRYSIFPDDMSYRILEDISSALCYLHGEEPPIIHRDLTANNVLLSGDMRAKVSDLGVARILDLKPGHRQLTPCPGAIDYMPQEALHENPTYDEKVDCFSYGILMLHLLCGKWPSPTAATQVDPLNPHNLLPINEVRRRRKYLNVIGTSHPLNELICRCLHNSPHHRPHAHEIMTEIQEVSRRYSGMSRSNKLDMVAKVYNAKEERELYCNQLGNVTEKYDSLLRETMQSCNSDIEKAEAMLVEERERSESLVKLERQRSDTLLESVQFEDRNRVQDLLQEIDDYKAMIPGLEKHLHAKDDIIKQLIARLNIQRHYPLTSKLPITFTELPSLPVAMCNLQCVVINGIVYVGGGLSDDNASLYFVFKYDPLQLAWNSLPKCSVRMFALLEYTGRLLTLGGITETQRILGDVQCFDEESQCWKDDEEIPPMSTKRFHAMIVTHGTSIAACGGVVHGGSLTDTVEVYQAGGRGWVMAASLPHRCCFGNPIIAGCTCYLVGGYFALIPSKAPTKCIISISLSDLFSLSSTGNNWKMLSSHTSTHLQTTPATFGGAILAIGGWDHVLRAATKDIHVFHSGGRFWKKIDNLTSACFDSVAAQIGTGEVMLIGGNDENEKKTRQVLLLSLAF